MSVLPVRRAAGDGLAGLLARVGRGDQAAFAALYHRTAAQVLGLVNLMLGEDAAAEDVTAAVYQQLWHTAACYDPAHSSAHAWLLDVARRHAAGHLRAHRASAAASAPTATGELASLPRAALPARLERLDAPARELIVLVCYRGYTTAQAASLLGLPAGTAAARLRAGLLALSPAPAPPPVAAASARQLIRHPRRTGRGRGQVLARGQRRQDDSAAIAQPTGGAAG